MDKIDKVDIYIDERIIEFLNNKNEYNGIDLNNKVREIIQKLLEIEKLEKYNMSVSIGFATKKEIQKLNKEYRGIDSQTDVLSFPIFSKEEMDELKKEKTIIPELNLGDVILCMEKIKEQSIEYRTGMKRELLYMITHSLCHLLGYDHIDEEDKKIMRKLEEKILSSIEV